MTVKKNRIRKFRSLNTSSLRTSLRSEIFETVEIQYKASFVN